MAQIVQSEASWARRPGGYLEATLIVVYRTALRNPFQILHAEPEPAQLTGEPSHGNRRCSHGSCPAICPGVADTLSSLSRLPRDCIGTSFERPWSAASRTPWRLGTLTLATAFGDSDNKRAVPDEDRAF